MPSTQRGSVVKRGRSWAVRWYDDTGERRFRGGFETTSAPREWLVNKVDEVAALRRSDPVATTREALTVGEAIKRYAAQHDVDPATLRTLRARLGQAVLVFGERKLGSLRPDELSACRRQLSAGYRHDLFRAFKQVLTQAERWKWIDENLGALGQESAAEAARDSPVSVVGGG